MSRDLAGVKRGRSDPAWGINGLDRGVGGLVAVTGLEQGGWRGIRSGFSALLETSQRSFYPHAIPQGRWDCKQFTGKETEAQEGQVISPRSDR